MTCIRNEVGFTSSGISTCFCAQLKQSGTARVISASHELSLMMRPAVTDQLLAVNNARHFCLNHAPVSVLVGPDVMV